MTFMNEISSNMKSYLNTILKNVMRIRRTLILLLIVSSVTTVFTQNSNLTESDIISKAQEFLKNKDYQSALPLFAQLVSVHPENPDFNYGFGVCTLYGDRNDKKRPIRYLNNAARSIKDNPELLYHLGMAYHQNMEFANAMKYYNLFLAKLSSNAPERALVLEKVNACLNGMNLLDKKLPMEIISKSEFQKNNFHRAYRADDFDGMLIIKPDIFLSSKEKMAGEYSFVFISEPRDVLYFSSYENKDSEDRDIFKVIMDKNGDWGEPEKVSSTINTSYDEDYPVVTDNGTTLYFCSKGHSSLGGYDIFRSNIDPSGSFSQPENLGIGINSPFDDILYILDKDKELAYFASDRDNLNSSINVFKIRVVENQLINDVILAEKEKPQNDPAEIETFVSSEKVAVSSENVAENTERTEKVQLVANEVPDSDPTRHAAKLKNNLSLSREIADSAYLMVANTKKQIRNLTNKRDRANSISKRKSDEAKTLEARFDENVANLTSVEGDEEFNKNLEETVKLKEEICQLYQRSNQMNSIAWSLGRQIKTKNQELNELKKIAAKVQSNSVAGNFEKTTIAFSEFKDMFETGDTLMNFSKQIVAITNNEMTYEIPESEFVFADKLKKSYENNTLLAEVNKAKPAIDKNVPVVIIDNRNKTTETTIAENKNTQPVKVVEQIHFVEPDIASIEPDETDMEINFNIDQVEAYKAIDQIELSELAYNDFDLDETDVEINFNIDRVEAYKAIEEIELSELAYNDFDLDENEVEINFNIDMVEAYKAIEEIEISEMAYNDFDLEENEVEINFNIDMVEAYKAIEEIEFKELAYNDSGPVEENLEINFETDKAELMELPSIIDPIYMEAFAYNLEPEENEVEINFNIDMVEAYEAIDQIEFNELAYNDSGPVEENLEIDFKIDNAEIIELQSIIQPIYTDAIAHDFDLDESDVEINFTIDMVEVAKIIEEIELSELAYNDFEQEEEQLEINFKNDVNNENIKPEFAAINNTLLYLRESVSKAGTIETSKSDRELLYLALNSPDELSYEELLFAASLANSTNDKLAIYNISFVHIDRDWRAFNNAAVTAIHANDFDQADCFLYQASLVTEDNGKIQNNLGILYCYKEEFEKAEKHFLAANRFGVNSHYNLQIVNSILKEDNDWNNNLYEDKQGSYKVLGDIIDYGTGTSND